MRCDVWTDVQQFNMSPQQQQQQQQFGLMQQPQQHRLMKLLVKIIKANGLADGDLGPSVRARTEAVYLYFTVTKCVHVQR